MRRRSALGVGVLVGLHLAGTVYARPPLVVMLGVTSESNVKRAIADLRAAMRELGWAEPRDITYDARWADGDVERLPQLAQEVVALAPGVIWAYFSGAAVAAKRATSTIPIVMGSSDAVRLGLVRSLAKPGGNVTGTSNQSVELSVKWVELLREAVPRVSRLALLWNPDEPAGSLVARDLRAALPASGMAFIPVRVRSTRDIEDTVAQLSLERAAAAVVAPSAFFTQHEAQISSLFARSRIPVIGERWLFDAGGALLNYQATRFDVVRLHAGYIDKILKGAKPADLPVQQPTHFRLSVSLKRARSLGITIPHPLLLRADEVID